MDSPVLLPGRAVLIAILAVFSFSGAAGAEDDISPEEIRHGYRATTLLAKPRAGVADVERAEAGAGARLIRRHARLGGLRILATDGREDVQEVIARLARTGLYEYVEPDYIRQTHVVPDDPRYATDQWSLNNTGQSGGTAGADIKAAAAWDIQREAPDVIVAVLDTGLRLGHEDINANLWTNRAEAAGQPSFDDDRDGYYDDVNGINATVAADAVSAANVSDVIGHGSHVAGIIGAVGNNGVGIAGVAWKVQIMPLKFIGRSGGTVSAAVACIDYAILKGAHIINGSYGSQSSSKAEFDAIKRARDAGIIFVASAGNDSQEITDLPEYPAAYNLDNIVAVAATTRQDKLASYSTYGAGLVELAAPGSSILSLGLEVADPYVSRSGTSMAAPHVSGALALLKQKFPDDNYRGLINRLLKSVDVLDALEHRVHTNGRLNLLRALGTTDTRPFNDDFAQRATVTGESNVMRASVQFAGLEPGEPAHGAGVTRSVWWRWTAPANAGKLTLSTAGSEFDTVVAVYSGTTVGVLQLIGTNDDSAPGTTTSSLSVDVVPNTTYAIAVGAKDDAPGVLTLAVSSVPINDAFAAAQALTGRSAVAKANNGAATLEAGEPRPRNSRGTVLGKGQTLWYKWTAPATRRFQISVTDEVIDPLVTVYTGATLSSLTQVASNDDAYTALYHYDSLVDFTATTGVTYYICVDVASGGGGRFSLGVVDADWQSLTFLPIYASPALAPDGTIYVVDDASLLFALTPDNVLKWAFVPDALDFVDGGAIAVGPDGTLYLGTLSGNFYAVSAAGAKKWVYTTGGGVWAPPAVAADGTVYVKSDDGQLYALNPDGMLKWKAAVPGDTYSGPTIAGDGTIYIASGGDEALYALNPDGTQKWRADLDATVYASPAIGSDGTIYLANYDGRFFALRPDGTRRWQFDTGSPVSGSAALDARGYVYFGSYDKKLHALDAATGVPRWEYATGDTIRGTTPLIADDGIIYIGSDDGLIHAVKPDGTGLRTFATGGPIIASPVLSAGRLYVASMDAKLYAFQVGTNLARSPWPMHRHNVRRSGRAVDPLPGMPVITAQPVAATATSGTAVSLQVAASVPDSGSLAYQWRINDVAIAGATNATFTLASAQASDVGSYNVVVTGPGGSIISQAVALTVTTGATNNSRLINLAVRTTAGAGDRVLFVGFVVGGDNTTGLKPLLLRGVGPTLAGFGVTGALADPKLEIYRASATTPLLMNDNWAGDAQVSLVGPQVGAFALAPATSKDAAVSTAQSAGGYTMQISSVDPAATGTVLAEIYDATPPDTFAATTPRLVNVSARTQVGNGGDILIAGFVVGGTSSKTVLVRAIGPTLTVFGVPGVLADPKLEVYQTGLAAAIASNDNWGAAPNAAQVAAAAVRVGAFPLALESKDAVLLVTLPPGTYTAQISGVNNGIGAAIVEVYEVP